MVELRDLYTREPLDGRTLKAGDKALLLSDDYVPLVAEVIEVEEANLGTIRLGLSCHPFNPDRDL